MKVVIFCDYYGNGGIEKVSNVLKNILIKKGYDVSLLCTIYNSQIFEKCKSISKYKIKNPIYRFIKTMLNIKKYTKEYDIVHLNVHSSVGLCYAYFLKNKKIIIHAHNSNFDKNYFNIKTFINLIFKKIFSKNNYTYIACSEKAANFCFDKKNKIEIIPNEFYDNYYFDNKIRKEIRKKYNIKDNEIVIGHIGRFEKQKNHEFLINVFDEFLKLHENSKLFLIGTGSLRKKIEKMLINKKIQNKVIILDYVQNTNEYYNCFDFFVFPSLYEGYGICFYEALKTSLKTFISSNIYQGEKLENLEVLSLNNSSKYWAEVIYQNRNYERKLVTSYDTFEIKINDFYSEVIK